LSKSAASCDKARATHAWVDPPHAAPSTSEGCGLYQLQRRDAHAARVPEHAGSVPERPCLRDGGRALAGRVRPVNRTFSGGTASVACRA